MGRRKVALANGYYYHVFNRSIAGFEIFRTRVEFLRMIDILRFYRTALPRRSFSQAVALGKVHDPALHGPARVKILAFCVMPTHFHFFLKQMADKGISEFMRCLAHSYSSYFNKKISRLGPLWESKFKSVLVDDDAFAIHLARYIHLNPVSAGLTERPEGWEFSSYHEYLQVPRGEPICEFRQIINMPPEMVRRHTENRADYQRSLQLIKHLLID